MKILSNTHARLIISGEEPDHSREEIRQAWQYLVDTGHVWSLSKWWGDMAMCQIAAGTLERKAP
jgi:hypothetical protein